jgi:hypothetical protein
MAVNLGLKAKEDEDSDKTEWIEFDGGGVSVALHRAHGYETNGSAMKLVFYAKDVEQVHVKLIKKKTKDGRGQKVQQTGPARRRRFCRKSDPGLK